ncbi:putative TOS1-like glycosyl hydrolase-domain-containing protein [Kalaharituber pfeilii]|nr:putative TOS1-like glycosyl hydrolase-domain-containing protein [Kalaharituber pfeilii]
MAILKSVFLGSVAALASLGFASASCRTINGLGYCNSVKQIKYDNLGYSGTYQDVVGIDLDSCSCTYAPKAFSGPLAPLNEGLSLHFRGPLHLKQFGVYYPKPKKSKSKRSAAHKHIKHNHHHAHHKRAVVVQTVTSTVVVDQTGATISPKPKDVENPSPSNHNHVPTAPPKPKGSGSDGTRGDSGPVFEDITGDDDDDGEDRGSEKWQRTAYYNAESQTAEGLVFMNHRGAQELSGAFTKCGGNSISFMTPDATAGSATPQILQNAPLKSRDEFIIFSNKSCDVATCGYWRPDIPAYQGFAGDKKIFVFEFSMPTDDSRPTGHRDDNFNRDLPSIWALNSKIPRTFQYGMGEYGSCSCWPSCGELDLFEVIVGANKFVKTHYHSDQGAKGQLKGGGGNPDYFDRPYEYIKAAVHFDGNKAATISILPSSISFPRICGSELVDVINQKMSSSSIFKLDG